MFSVCFARSQSYPAVPAEFTDDWTLSIDTELNFGTMRNAKEELMAEIEKQLEKLCTVGESLYLRVVT